ncbi:MAG: PEP-CTERM sorting domain-containing protein [Deltaproteobacteria bacterium]|nr:PEP-CTERM sorting domain-containing protein [Deltaproteobacteria bacterium]
MKRLLLLSAGVVAGLADPASAGSIQSLGVGNANPTAVSASGFAVAGDWSPLADRLEAFRWTRSGGALGLGNLGGGPPVFGIVSQAFGLSGDGLAVVGFSADDAEIEAFRWSAQTGMLGLGQLDEAFVTSQATGASFDGSVVVGAASTNSGQEAFRWTSQGGLVGLGDLGGAFGFRSYATGVSADGAVVTGNAGSTTSGSEAFRWTAAQGMIGLGDLPGGVNVSYGTAVSANGSTIVGYSESSSGIEAFRWTSAGGMVGLGDLAGGGFASRALGVSGDGSVVVGYGASASAGQEAFIWTISGGLEPLDTHLIAAGIDLQGWQLTMANAISADGRTLVGTGVSPDDLPAAWIVTLPEPAAGLSIAGVGLLILGRSRLCARSARSTRSS